MRGAYVFPKTKFTLSLRKGNGVKILLKSGSFSAVIVLGSLPGSDVVRFSGSARDVSLRKKLFPMLRLIERLKKFGLV